MYMSPEVDKIWTLE